LRRTPTTAAETPSAAEGHSGMESELEHVLQCYSLGQLSDACRVKQGFINENWLVVTTRGRFFVKRRHPSYRHSGLIRAQHELIEHLRRHGFPAPRLIKTLKDDSILGLDGRWYEIQEFIDGIPYDPNRPAHLEQAALTLGLYHRCVEGFDRPVFRSLGDLYSPATAKQALARLVRTWSLDTTPLLSDLVRRLGAEVRNLAARFAHYGALPRLVIHGDYYADNLIFEGDRIVGVVDYDRARWEARVAELSEALIYFASPRASQMKHIVYPGFLRWGPLSNFLESYGDTCALAEDEVRAIPDLVSAIWLSWSLRRLAEGEIQPDGAFEALQEVFSLVDWALANAEQMIDAARSAVLRRSARRMSEQRHQFTLIR
jgi:homoserine kinase type II